MTAAVQLRPVPGYFCHVTSDVCLRYYAKNDGRVVYRLYHSGHLLATGVYRRPVPAWHRVTGVYRRRVPAAVYAADRRAFDAGRRRRGPARDADRRGRSPAGEAG